MELNPNIEFDKNGILADDIINEEKQLVGGIENSNSIEAGFFICRTANDCINDAKLQPPPKKLYYDLIIENELTILVADTGIGKSIYSVQIAEEISKTTKVLYLDLELSDKQFQARYSEDYKNEYSFNENFYRCTFKRRFDTPSNISYEDFFINSVKGLVEKTGARVIIIDNMTKLISTDSDQARSAKPLMDSLNELKFDYNLTMLLLEHTKKVDPSRPIHLNDLQGSKMKANFADAVFTIGRSAKDKNIRYVKQLKVRSAETMFDGENVLVYQVEKVNSFLKFKFMDYGNEAEHLKQITESDRSETIEKAKELQRQGKSQRSISTELGISLGTVNKYLKL